MPEYLQDSETSHGQPRAAEEEEGPAWSCAVQRTNLSMF